MSKNRSNIWIGMLLALFYLLSSAPVFAGDCACFCESGRMFVTVSSKVCTERCKFIKEKVKKDSCLEEQGQEDLLQELSKKDISERGLKVSLDDDLNAAEDEVQAS